MSQVKGVALLARLRYMREKCTADQNEKIMALLGREIRDKIEHGHIVHGHWYPLHYLTDISLAIDTVAGRGDKAMLVDLSRYSVREASKGIFKVFFQLASLDLMVKRTPAIWDRYYDSGKLFASLESETSGRTMLHDFDEPDHDHCLIVQGWIIGVLEVFGAKNVSVQNTQCRRRGAPVCEFILNWDK